MVGLLYKLVHCINLKVFLQKIKHLFKSPSIIVIKLYEHKYTRLVVGLLFLYLYIIKKLFYYQQKLFSHIFYIHDKIIQKYLEEEILC